MIAYDDLVAALMRWRERQGLPVRRAELFDRAEDSIASLGADAFATPFVPDTGQGTEGTEDTGETRLGTADIAAEDESPFAAVGAEDEDSTFVGTSPGWSSSEPEQAAFSPPADAESAASPLGEDTGESARLPTMEGDELEDEIDSALAESEPAPEQAEAEPGPPEEGVPGGGGFIAASTELNTPLPEEPATSAEASGHGDPFGGEDVSSPLESAADPESGQAPLDWSAEAQPAPNPPSESEISVDDSAILGEDEARDEPATAIRDPGAAEAAPPEPAEPLPEPPPGEGRPSDNELSVDLDDVLESEREAELEGEKTPQ